MRIGSSKWQGARSGRGSAPAQLGVKRGSAGTNPRLGFAVAAPLAFYAVALLGCSSAGTASGAESAASVEGGSAGATPEPHTPPGPLVRPSGRMTLSEAQRYVLALVNRDRAEHGLKPVTWSDIPAKAGQRQADDMAAHGFTAHLGTDGSVPELRYTQAGGKGMVMENVGCFADAEPRVLDPTGKFTAEGLEKIQHAFMDEIPPFDGHRRNILTPYHTSFGVGLALTAKLDVPCMAQEFVDDFGDFDDLPRKATVGTKIKVRGALRPPAEFGGVGVARVATPKPLKPKALNKTGSYAIPKPATTYFPKGFKTPIPVQVDGNTFSIELPLSVEGKPGLYQISIWAKLPPSKDLVMVSLRTIDVH